MRSLGLAATWPVDNYSVAVIDRPLSGGRSCVDTLGDPDRRYRLASLAKPLTAWATLVAVEEGLLALDTPVGQPGCTLRHLLAHAGGYAFDGAVPITAPARRRIYSNTGIEMAAAAVEAAAEMPFAEYASEAVFRPLGMASTTMSGSPAHGVHGTLTDLCAFVEELIAPRLLSRQTATLATQPVFADLAGLVPGVGRYARCSWGLGIEVKGDKTPHWTGNTNSARAFGHFGGAGTFLWVDLGVVRDRAVACVALTDRPFDEWAQQALVLWPQFSDAVVAEVSARART